jgi:hypothetical protein
MQSARWPCDCDLADLALKDSTWQSKRRPYLTAKAIGCVRAASQGPESVYFAQWKRGTLQGFRKRSLSGFLTEWERKDSTTPSWKAVLTELNDRKATKRRLGSARSEG